MFGSIGGLIGNLWDGARGEFSDLRDCLVAVLVATVVTVGVMLSLKFYREPSIEICITIAFLPLAFSLYRLLAISRLVGVFFAGEAIQRANAKADPLQGTILADAHQSIPESGIWSIGATSQLFRTYMKIIFGIISVQMILFLLLPLYVCYTDGGFVFAIIIFMLVAVVTIGSYKFAARMFQQVATVTAVVYMVIGVFVLFPQFRFYANYIGADKINIVPQSTAKIANEIDQLRARQREVQNNSRLREGLDWQRSNPGQELPQYYKEKVEEVGKVISSQETSQPKPRSQPEPRVAQSAAAASSSSLSEKQERLNRMYAKRYGN